VLVIEDNLHNNYCNISLNSTCRNLYVSEPPAIYTRKERKNFIMGQFFRKGEPNIKNPKDKKKKTLNPFLFLSCSPSSLWRKKKKNPQESDPPVNAATVTSKDHNKKSYEDQESDPPVNAATGTSTNHNPP
jgi:hypothetical protein